MTLPRTLCLLLALLLPQAGAHAAELVMFDQDGCPICLRWDRELGAIYPKTDEARRAPLRRVHLGTDIGIALAEPVRYTPTFVLVEEGREIGRVTGYHNDEMFWGAIDVLIARLPATAARP